jgi:hypothetical protein
MKIYLLILMTLTGQLQAIEYDKVYEQDLSANALKITRDEQGNWLEITANEWHDVVFTEQGEKAYIYQQGYNYQKQSGFLRTYTPDKKLVSEVWSPEGGGMVSREEILLSFELFKKHPEINQVLAKENEAIKLFGGFGYVDNEPNQACYQGKRCVHVFAHTDSKTMVAHAIVKLSDQTIPYPDFDGLYNKKEEIK